MVVISSIFSYFTTFPWLSRLTRFSIFTWCTLPSWISSFSLVTWRSLWSCWSRWTRWSLVIWAVPVENLLKVISTDNSNHYNDTTTINCVLVVLIALFASIILDIIHTFRIPWFSFSFCFYFFSTSFVIASRAITAAYKQFVSFHNQVNDEICTVTLFNANILARSSRIAWSTRFTIYSISTWFTIPSRCSRITRNAFTWFTTRTWFSRLAR